MILALVIVVGGLINLISCGKSYKIHKRSSLRSRSNSVTSIKSGSLEAAINKLNRTKKASMGITKSESKLNRSVSITDSLLLEPIKKNNSNMIAELEASQKLWPKNNGHKKSEPSAPAEETPKSFGEIRAILMRNERFKSAVEASKHLPVLKSDDNVSIKSNKSRSFMDIRPVNLFNEAEFKSQSRKILFLKK